MKTGEKIAFLRKRKGLTQEQMSEILEVSRQSVSRWELNIAFPETEKLIRLGRLLDCSIDYLLNENNEENVYAPQELLIDDVYRFIRECGYFFLATDSDGKPNQRPMGMIYCRNNTLYIGTDRRKKLYAEMKENPNVCITSYSLLTRGWARIMGQAFEETSIEIYKAMKDSFPMLKQKYSTEGEIHFVIMRICILSLEMN